MEVPGRKKHQEGARDDALCQPCHGDGENVSAEGYCETCQEYFCSMCLRLHRKQTISRNHVIKLQDEMPIGKTLVDPCLESCSLHEPEVMKFYCKIHDSVGCGDCMILDHKTCKVDLVQNVSGEYKNSNDLRETMQKLEQLQGKVTSCKQNITQNLKGAPERKEKVVSEIKMLREEMNRYLDAMEADILMQIEKIDAENLGMRKNLKEECKAIEKEIAELQSKLNPQSKKVNQIFVAGKCAKKRHETLYKSLKSIKRKCSMSSYHFEPSNTLLDLRNKRSSLGSIVVSSPGDGAKGSVTTKKKPIADTKTRFVKTISVKDEAEHKDCYISGLAKITDTEIVLADRYNKSLKILNVAECSISARVEPSSAPWDVTVVGPDTIAATLPSEGKIIFLTTDGLSEIHCLNLKQECRGIDCQNDKLAVSFCNPLAFQILNLNGDVLHKIKTVDSDLFPSGSYPSYIAWSREGKCIWLADHGASKLRKVTLDGQIKSEIKSNHLKQPRGLAVAADGSVIACCQGSRDRVGIIPPESNEMLSLKLGNVRTPHTTLLCETSNMLYITEYSTDCNVMKVFNLK